MMSHCITLHAFVSGMCLHHKLAISWKFNIIHAKIVKQFVCAKVVGFKMWKWHYIYIYILVMFWYEVHLIYILTKCVQLLWYNFG